ncbi:hypothetical protein [Lysinibacillus sp. NPDC056232]|uniref:hypothetical protein n=1 Tax=Lysinibacillus sp. NPDC056232 TaxID=3345756 RepID=UPI0035DA10D2
MYCKKLLDIVSFEESKRYLIDKLIIYKLDEYLKNRITLRERKNINPVKFAIEMGVEYKIAIMTFIVGSRVKLFKIRLFYECDCGERKELETTKENIECECGKIGNYESLKENIKLYFQLLEIPTPCEWNEQYSNEADLLKESDLLAFDNSFSDIEKVGGSELMNEIKSDCFRDAREALMERYIGEESEGI